MHATLDGWHHYIFMTQMRGFVLSLNVTSMNGSVVGFVQLSCLGVPGPRPGLNLVQPDWTHAQRGPEAMC